MCHMGDGKLVHQLQFHRDLVLTHRKKKGVRLDMFVTFIIYWYSPGQPDEIDDEGLTG